MDFVLFTYKPAVPNVFLPLLFTICVITLSDSLNDIYHCSQNKLTLTHTSDRHTLTFAICSQFGYMEELKLCG